MNVTSKVTERAAKASWVLPITLIIAAVMRTATSTQRDSCRYPATAVSATTVTALLMATTVVVIRILRLVTF